jgi:hypothetical protein
MKKLFLITVVFSLLASFLYVSCKKSEKVYSCNEEINEYAVKTMSSHQNISRNDLVKFGIDTQFAVFNSLSPENRIRIFKEKIEALIIDDSISNADKNHLKLLNNYLSSITDFQDFNPDVDSFVSNWKSYASNNLSWTGLEFYVYVETWLLKDELITMGAKINLEVYAGGGACKCTSRFACSFGMSSCASGGCARTDTGCGMLGNSPCTGTCSYWAG